MSEGLLAGAISTAGSQAVGSVAGVASDRLPNGNAAAAPCEAGAPEFAEQLGASTIDLQVGFLGFADLVADFAIEPIPHPGL